MSRRWSRISTGSPPGTTAATPEAARMALSLAAAEQGSGPPLLILHGLFGSGRNWAAIAKALSAERRIISLDLRNHGASPWAPSMAYPEMAEDVLDFMDSHGLERAALLGHSMGGKAAMVAALS